MKKHGRFIPPPKRSGNSRQILLKEDDMDFILLSADTYCINGMESYLAIYMVDMEDDSDITAYILAVPKRTLWCDAAKLDILYAIGMEDEDVSISYSDAITCGPKAVIRMEVCNSTEEPWTDFAVFNQFMKEVDEMATEVEETGEIKVDFQSEEAWNEILGW